MPKLIYNCFLYSKIQCVHYTEQYLCAAFCVYDAGITRLTRKTGSLTAIFRVIARNNKVPG